MRTTLSTPAISGNPLAIEQDASLTVPAQAMGTTVVFASSERDRQAKLRLIFTLMQRLGLPNPYRNRSVSAAKFTLLKTALGGPYLVIDGRPGPTLSFSRGKQRLWAAMAAQESVGVDRTHPGEFCGNYPLHRAFRAQELDCARCLGIHNVALAAALIWSLKEAAVKALGTGFHRFDPLAVRVANPRIKGQGILFDVRAGSHVSACAIPAGRGWLAVAWTLPEECLKPKGGI